MTKHIAICMATYRRRELLCRALQELGKIELPSDVTVELRIIDNDAAGSAQPLVRVFTENSLIPWTVNYEIEPRRNIAHARNRALDMGPADLYAFIDDDGVVSQKWLTELIKALDSNKADAVFGTVYGKCPEGTPRWISRGHFFDHHSGASNRNLHWRGTRCGNALVRGEWLAEKGFRFDPEYGLTGAEDTELFSRMAGEGACYNSAPESSVWENVESDRTNFGWLWKRHLRGGRNYQRMVQIQEPGMNPGIRWARSFTASVCRSLLGLPAACINRPERLIRGLLGFAVAIGGIQAWLQPKAVASKVEYTVRPLTA